MQKFEAGDLYRPSSQGQGFAPITAPDITPLLRENNRARLEEAQNFANARMADLRMEEQALKYQQLAEDEQVANLAKFSTSLSELVVKAAEKRNEAEEQRGLMLAYTNGVDPNAAAEFDAGEAALEQGATDINKAAGQFYQEGMPVEMVQQVQNLSGWAKYGYMRGIAEQGGANYGNFYMQAAQTLKVNVPGREEPITLMEATTAAERAAVKSVIADQYMAQYRGMNPLLMNKYLFPKMKEWERADDLQFAEEQRENYKLTQEAEFRDELRTGVLGETPGFSFEKTLNRYEGFFGGSMARTKAFAFEELGKLADSGTLTPEMVERIKETEIINRATGKKEKIGKMWANDFDNAKLEQRFDKQLIQNQNLADAAREAEFKQQWEEVKEQDREQRGDGQYSEALEEGFKQRLLSDLGYVPKWFNEKNSAYDRDVQSDIDNLNRLAQAGLPITETTIMKLHPEAIQYARQNYKVIPDSNALDPSSKLMTRVTDFAKYAAQERFGVDANNARTTNFKHFQERYVEDFTREYYAELDATGDPAQAAKNALATVELQAKPQIINGKSVSKYDTPLDTNQTRASSSNFVTAKLAMDGKNYTTTKLPGLEPAVEQLKHWVETGEGTLPVIFHGLANGKPGVSGWDIARHQYLLHTNSELARDLPSRDRAISEREPEVRDLLNQYPSPGRNTRAYVLSSGSNFNDPAFLGADVAQTQPLGYVTRKFRNAIFTQESGGRYDAVGQYVPGQGRAVGIGQVMPANIGPWTKKYYGKALTPEEYLANPAAQDAVVNGEFNRMLTREFKRGASEEVAVRRAAAEWYGGPGAIQHWNNPGYKGAFGDHPNMAEYTTSIWRKYQGIN